MTLLKLAPVGVTLLLACALSAAVGARDGKPPKNEANRMTGILKSVDAAHATFTIGNVGVDVDEALSRRLKERDGAAGKNAMPQAADAVKTQVVGIDAKTKIYIKFRSSPSVSNNAEQSLKDLERMVGWPVTLEIGRKGDPVVASEVIAWRGTPWKISSR